MADSAESQQFTLNIKGPSDLKLSVTVASDATVEQLKEAVCRLARLPQRSGHHSVANSLLLDRSPRRRKTLRSTSSASVDRRLAPPRVAPTRLARERPSRTDTVATFAYATAHLLRTRPQERGPDHKVWHQERRRDPPRPFPSASLAWGWHRKADQFRIGNTGQGRQASRSERRRQLVDSGFAPPVRSGRRPIQLCRRSASHGEPARPAHERSVRRRAWRVSLRFRF